MATLEPAGMVKLRLLKMRRSGWYPKVIFSKRIEPPWSARGGAWGGSYNIYEFVKAGFDRCNPIVPQVECDLLVDRKEPPCQANSDASHDI